MVKRAQRTWAPPANVVEKFEADVIGRFKAKGDCVGAALLAFLDLDAKRQGEYLKRLYADQIDSSVEGEKNERSG